MNPELVADSIIDICGAIGLAVAILTLLRRDAKGPLTSRFGALLGIVATLFWLRGVAWWLGSDLVDRLSLLPAASIPLVALFVTEGVLRRHLPRGLKLAGLIGAIALGAMGALGMGRFEIAYLVALAAFQIIMIAACAVALIRRDRASLSSAENVMIDRLAGMALFVLPFVLTDFRSLMPGMPIRLGALGTLLLLAIVLTTAGSAEKRWQKTWLLVLRIGSAACLGVSAAFVSAPADIFQIIRYAAIAIAGVLTIGMMADALRAVLEARAPGLLGAIAGSVAPTREAVIAELSEHALFASSRRCREADLGAYDPSIIRPFLASRKVVRRADSPWRLARTDPAAERIASLMMRIEATHLIVIGHAPIDILAVNIPVVSADPATETALALIGRVLLLSPEAA